MTTKMQSAYERVLDALQREREYTLKELLWEVNYHAEDIELFVSMTTLRKAVALLPDGCVTRDGQRIIVAARHFAPAAEVVAMLQALPHWSDYLPVLIERHRPTLRRALMLADEWALSQSLEWASTGVYEIVYSVYGVSVRWLKAVAA